MTGVVLGDRVAILEGAVGRLQRELSSLNRKLAGICEELSEQHAARLADRDRIAQLEQELAELRGEAVGAFSERSFAEAN